MSSLRAQAASSFSFSMELARAACTVPIIELGCRVLGPKPLAGALRRVGSFTRRRDPEARLVLRRAIRAIDALETRITRRTYCYRRSLVEIALDRGAAEEKLFIGLYARGGFGSGHAWLESEGPAREKFDVELVI